MSRLSCFASSASVLILEKKVRRSEKKSFWEIWKNCCFQKHLQWSPKALLMCHRKGRICYVQQIQTPTPHHCFFSINRIVHHPKEWMKSMMSLWNRFHLWSLIFISHVNELKNTYKASPTWINNNSFLLPFVVSICCFFKCTRKTTKTKEHNWPTYRVSQNL